MKVQLLIDGKLRSVALTPVSTTGEAKGALIAELDGERIELDAAFPMPGVLSLIVRAAPGGSSGALVGRSFRCIYSRSDANQTITIGDQSFSYQVHDPRSLATRRQRSGGDEGTLLLKATMAGRVVRILAAAEAEVEAHAGIIVIEAMKMQNELRTPRAGRVVELRVAAGEMVSSGQILAVIE